MLQESEIGIIRRAVDISHSVLKRNLGSSGYLAGGTYFSETNWGRDALYALQGKLAVGEVDEVEKNLDFYLLHQRSDGAIPLRVERKSHTSDFVNIWPLNREHNLIARYKSSQPWAGETIDTTALYVITAAEFRKHKEGENWWQKRCPSMEKAGRWLKSKIGRNGLVTEGLIAGWADDHLKSGNTGYVNVLAWKAFSELGWQEDADSLKAAFNKLFWNGQRRYFIDWISPRGERHEDFCADVNVLSIALGLASREQAIDVQKLVEEKELNRIPIATYYPRTNHRRDLWTRLFFPSYNDVIFMWWGGWEVLCQKAVGEKEKAVRDASRLARIFVNHNTAPESVLFDGTLRKNSLVRPQLNMTWSAGTLLLAAGSLGIL